MATDGYNEMWQFHFIFMKSIHFNFNLTYFFTSLQYFAQTWCDNVDHGFKKSTSGRNLPLTFACPPSRGLDDAAVVLALLVAKPRHHGGHQGGPHQVGQVCNISDMCTLEIA